MQLNCATDYVAQFFYLPKILVGTIKYNICDLLKSMLLLN